ncbi:MAG: UDP-3-O-[3-hydroxymyristoyl] N-acetylglucosamine deacetylase [Candidatus Tokpelaia sp. JSC189]|nr:MAG: UDP-3-O-[3-hydroxymyristoyl] N-acetylglucosamine deacetylase [Candidatus Tokpelaia sp. JSC189]
MIRVDYSVKSFQSTLKKSVTFSGYGVHSGKPSIVILNPATADHGIIFSRVDEVGNRHFFPADTFHAGPTDLCTTLGQGNVRIDTIEHLMAAITAASLDNLAVEVSTCEIPILDGSSATYMQAIAQVGIKKQKAARKYIRVLETVRVESGSSYAEFSPSDAMNFDISIVFNSAVIAKQHLAFSLNTEYFVREIAPARTFGFLKDVETLWTAGLALGSSFENSVVIGPDDAILNSGGLIADDEFVRHKALDAIGDTALLGRPFIGLFRSFKGGHRLNAEAVRALLNNPQHYGIIEIPS